MPNQLLINLQKRFQRKARLLAQVPPGKYWLVLKLVLFASVVPLLMRLPLSRSQRILVPSKSSQANATIFLNIDKQTLLGQHPISNYIYYTDIALRLGKPLTQHRCLTRCVTLYYFLSRQGVDLAIVFGAGSLHGQFAAHCWLEADGMPIGEPENPYTVYSPTYSIPTRVFENSITDNG